MIAIQGLKKQFDGKPVLKGVDLEVETGEALAIIGRSGCGKSVLLKHLLGLLDADEGEIHIDGKSVKNADPVQIREVRLRFGMVFQNSALFDSLSVAENVGFGLAELTRQKKSGIRSRALECLEMVGLKDWADHEPAALSGGMRKRVAFARAMAMRPDFLLYDEPTSGLDPITADAIDELMVKLTDSLKVTSIAVTHDLKSARRIASRIALMHEGRIHWEGASGSINECKDPVVKQFVEGTCHGPVEL